MICQSKLLKLFMNTLQGEQAAFYSSSLPEVVALIHGIGYELTNRLAHPAQTEHSILTALRRNTRGVTCSCMLRQHTYRAIDVQ